MKKARNRNESSRISIGRGNVFSDLGFGADADELQLKAELSRQIHLQIKSAALSQSEAAALLKLSQPDVSRLTQGRHSRFSVGRLLTLLNKLRVDVQIVLTPRADGNGERGRLSVKRPAA